MFALQQNWRRSRRRGCIVAVYATTLFSTALPIKIWNSNRNEKKLEQQQLRLNEARLAALSRQINPHFLFNTLNSVASLIRMDPDQARQVVYKLSKILRRLLRQQENLTTLGEELSFIDDYLAIEMVRFGEKLRFVKDIDPATLDHAGAQHAAAAAGRKQHPPRAFEQSGRRHRPRAQPHGGPALQILVEDDGVGIPEAKLATLFEQGIGVSNVNERLKVLFGDDYKMWIDSRLGEGTSTGIEIPEQASGTVVEESLTGSQL